MWSMPISSSRSSYLNSTRPLIALLSSSRSPTECRSTPSSFAISATTAATTLARTWLLDPQPVEGKASRPSHGVKRPWNGRDFYIVLGRVDDPWRGTYVPSYP